MDEEQYIFSDIIEKIREFNKIADEAIQKIDKLYIQACLNPPKLKPASEKDLKIGQLIWIEWGEQWDENDESSFLDFRFVEVEELIGKDAYYTEGCIRYLEGAFIEDNKTTE